MDKKLPLEIVRLVSSHLEPCDLIALSQSCGDFRKGLNPVWTLDISGSKFPSHEFDAALEALRIPDHIYASIKCFIYGPEDITSSKASF
jgi:hypothetical protein